jgi:hypothetical protein
MAMQEPGLDRHEWETELQSLEDDLRDDPESGLPQLADLVERMLVERGFTPEDPVASDGADPEILASYRAARETATLAERGDVDPGDVGDAIEQLRAVFDYLVAERSAP